MDVFLETERLVLRPFTDADAEHLFALDNDPEVMRFLTGGKPTSRETIRTKTLPRFLHDHPGLGTRSYWAAEGKATGTFLGWFEFSPLDDHSPAVVELGYRLNRLEPSGSGAASHVPGEETPPSSPSGVWPSSPSGV
ncbi:GNAT family N-acetyltransferase [Streptomyces asiaticus]